MHTRTSHSKSRSQKAQDTTRQILLVATSYQINIRPPRPSSPSQQRREGEGVGAGRLASWLAGCSPSSIAIRDDQKNLNAIPPPPQQQQKKRVKANSRLNKKKHKHKHKSQCASSSSEQCMRVRPVPSAPVMYTEEKAAKKNKLPSQEVRQTQSLERENERSGDNLQCLFLRLTVPRTKRQF